MGEVWKDIPNYNGMYQISSLGNIKSLKRTVKRKNNTDITIHEKILSKKQSTNEYYFVYLCKDGIPKFFLIHRLIAIVFIPNPENKPHINHKNGIKTDNRIENLEWCTRSENLIHAIKLGLKKQPRLYGKRNPMTKLNELKVRDIKQLLSQGIMQKDIAEKFNVDPSTIRSIAIGKTWSYV